jgi:hypothetical protein
MIINTTIYDLLLGLDFLIKIGHVVNVKKNKNPSKARSWKQHTNLTIEHG